MTTTPTLPGFPWFDPKTGNPTPAFRSHYEALWRNAGSVENAITSNVNSGVAQAQAAAQAAQVTADAAAQQAADVGEAALAFSASASPASVGKVILGSGSATTNSTTVTPSGGTGPYTYAWSHVSGDTFTPNSPASATTNFTTALSTGQDKSAVYRCTVTDSLAATATATVGVSATSNA